MAIIGKKITMYLIDGQSNGRIMCELSNWSGKAYRIPRSLVNISSDRPDLAHTGVYILFGKDEIGNNIAYIGEAEHIYNRLKQHLAQKDFWNEAIVFISKDDNLNKAHIKYLEGRLYEIASKSKRYKLENSSKPAKVCISEPDTAEMEEFIEKLNLLVGTMGHKIFETQISSKIDISEKKVYQIKKKNYFAEGLLTEDGFLVFKGASIAPVLGVVSKSVDTLRQKLVNEGNIIDNKDSSQIMKNTLFNSPSLAATIVLGVSANGLKEWTHEGASLKEMGE